MEFTYKELPKNIDYSKRPKPTPPPPKNNIVNRMNCWHCGNPMIWGGDFSFEDCGMENKGIISNFSCSVCPATAEVSLPE